MMKPTTSGSRERVMRVLQGELPDRVPVLMQNFQNTAFLAGISLQDFSRDPQLMAEAQITAWERFGYDVLDLENGTAALAEALGGEVIYAESEPPRLGKPLIRDLDEIDRLKPVDPRRDGHLPQLIKATSLVKSFLKERACIVGEADQGPFSLAALLVGMETWLLALLDEQKTAQVFRLLEFCTQQTLALALAQYEAGADFVQIGDAIAGPDLCSPKIYRKFAFPFEMRLVEELNRRRIPLILHICGNTTRIIADMAATGAPMLEVDYKIDMAACREQTKKRSTLIGNVDPSGVMALGTPQEVTDHCKRAIRAMGREGYFMLSSGCTLPWNAPPENTQAMMEAARRYGAYSDSGLTGPD